MSPKLFDRLAGRAVDSALGGRISVAPWTSGDVYGEPGPDPTRPPMVITGHFAPDPGVSDVRGQVMGAEPVGGSRFSVMGFTTIVLTEGQYARLGYQIRKGDRLQCLDEPGAPTFSAIKAPHRQGNDVEIYVASEDVS